MDRDTTERYKRRRYEVMNEDEIKESEQFLDWYRSAWMDKDNRGLFDLWEMAEKYYKGEINFPETESDPGSETNIILSNVEGQVALLADQNIAINAKPQGPSDAIYAENVRVMLEWVKEKNNLQIEQLPYIRRLLKFGTGIYRVTFDPDYANGFGLPRIDACNPAYVFVDPNIVEVKHIQSAEFVIETMMKSIYWAKNNESFIEGRADAITPGYDTMFGDTIFDESEGNNDEIRNQNYMHMLIWTKKKGKLRLIEMSGDGVILRDSAEDSEEDFYPNGMYPYFFTSNYPIEGSIWGLGDVELLIRQQDMINMLDDQILINAGLSGNIQKVVNTGSGIDLDKWTNEAGLIIPCNTNPREAFTIIQPPSMPEYVMNRRDRALDVDRPIITRFSDQQIGVRQKGIDTATEAIALQQSGTAAIDFKKMIIQNTLSQVFNYVLDLIKEYWTEEQAFTLTESEADYMFFTASDLKEIPRLTRASDTYIAMYKAQQAQMNPMQDIETPKYMVNTVDPKKEAEFDIQVTVGAGLPNNKAFVYQIMKEIFAAKLIPAETFLEYLQKNLGLPVDVKKLQEQQAQQQAQMMAMQQQQQAPMNPDIQGLTGAGNPMTGGLV